jgi:hypothetical protein
MKRLLFAVGLATVTSTVASACMAAGAGQTPSSAKLSIVARALDGQALPGAIVYVCEAVREAQHPPEKSEVSCQVGSTGADGVAVFRVDAGPNYSATAALEGFSDTTVFPLSFGPDAEPKAPQVVVLVLNAVCYDC